MGAMFKQKKDKAAITLASLEKKPPYLDKVAIIQFPPEYKVPKFQKFDCRKGNKREQWLTSLILWAFLSMIQI